MISVYSSMKRICRAYVRNCRRRNIYWELSIEEFHNLTSQRCHYCGRPPSNQCRTYTYNGLDRLDNRKGYVLSNVVACCRECNSIKSNILTAEEMRAIAQTLIKIRLDR